MEEARQHSALTREQWFFAAVFFGGPATLLFGIVLILLGQNYGITIGIVGYALSKVIIAAWAIFRPQSQVTQRSLTSRLFVAIVWGAIAISLVVLELKK